MNSDPDLRHVGVLFLKTIKISSLKVRRMGVRNCGCEKDISTCEEDISTTFGDLRDRNRRRSPINDYGYGYRINMTTESIIQRVR